LAKKKKKFVLVVNKQPLFVFFPSNPPSERSFWIFDERWMAIFLEVGGTLTTLFFFLVSPKIFFQK